MFDFHSTDSGKFPNPTLDCTFRNYNSIGLISQFNHLLPIKFLYLSNILIISADGKNWKLKLDSNLINFKQFYLLNICRNFPQIKAYRQLLSSAIASRSTHLHLYASLNLVWTVPNQLELPFPLRTSTCSRLRSSSRKTSRCSQTPQLVAIPTTIFIWHENLTEVEP